MEYKNAFFDVFFFCVDSKIKITNFLKIVQNTNFTKIYLNEDEILQLPKSKVLIFTKSKKN